MITKITSILFIINFAIYSCEAQQNSSKIATNMNKLKLIEAVKQNDTTKISTFIKQSTFDINTKDNEGRSLLLIATNHQYYEMTKLLVKNGADVNKQAKNKDSAFLYAGATGQTELVKIFLQYGARFDIYNRYNGTALIPACERGHIETVRLLANTKNFPIDHVNRLGWTGLMEAVILGDGSTKYQQIIQILKAAGANMHIPDLDGTTPLQHAERRGFTEIVAILKS